MLIRWQTTFAETRLKARKTQENNFWGIMTNLINSYPLDIESKVVLTDILEETFG